MNEKCKATITKLWSISVTTLKVILTLGVALVLLCIVDNIVRFGVKFDRNDVLALIVIVGILYSAYCIWHRKLQTVNIVARSRLHLTSYHKGLITSRWGIITVQFFIKAASTLVMLISWWCTMYFLNFGSAALYHMAHTSIDLFVANCFEFLMSVASLVMLYGAVFIWRHDLLIAWNALWNLLHQQNINT